MKSKFLAGALAALTGVIMSWSAQAGPIDRLAANWDYFGFETFTSSQPPGSPGFPVVPTISTGGSGGHGVQIYRKVVFVPFNRNTMYVSFYATGDQHNGAGACFTALIDGQYMNSGLQGAARCKENGEGRAPGWIPLVKLPQDVQDPQGFNNCADGGGGSADCHDNGVSYQWCSRIKPGIHRVEVWMATTHPKRPVFLEQAHFFVDASRVRSRDRCVLTKEGGLPTPIPGPIGVPPVRPDKGF